MAHGHHGVPADKIALPGDQSGSLPAGCETAQLDHGPRFGSGSRVDGAWQELSGRSCRIGRVFSQWFASTQPAYGTSMPQSGAPSTASKTDLGRSILLCRLRSQIAENTGAVRIGWPHATASPRTGTGCANGYRRNDKHCCYSDDRSHVAPPRCMAPLATLSRQDGEERVNRFTDTPIDLVFVGTTHHHGD